MEICKTIADVSWRPHPVAKGVTIKPLVTKSEDGLNVTCMLVKIPAGVEVPEHIHAGTFPLKPGIVVRVPKGTKHKIFNVAEELLIYDVFQPPTL
jgi:quercetin dioxygenase-like cupin family protein